MSDKFQVKIAPPKAGEDGGMVIVKHPIGGNKSYKASADFWNMPENEQRVEAIEHFVNCIDFEETVKALGLRATQSIWDDAMSAGAFGGGEDV